MALQGFVGSKKGRTSFDAVHVHSEDGDVSDTGFCIFSNYGAPTNGTSGTRAGQAPIGSLLADTQNGVLYVNTGTMASVTWTKVGTQS